MVSFLKAKASDFDAYPSVSTGALKRPRGLSLMGGVPVAGRLPSDLVFQVSDGSAVAGLTDFMTGVGVFVVSDALKDIVSRFTSTVEFIPVGIEYDGTLRSGYSIFNPVLLVDGVDLSASSLKLNSVGLAVSVERLVLNEQRFAGVHVGLVHEVRQIAVSRELGDAIMAAGCTGCRLVVPQDFRL